MMKTKITERDWEILSAYLDGELSPRDNARLESKLQGNPELGDALTELRRTRALLRSQPRLRAPRNFTLTPDMTGVRKPAQPSRRLAPVFGMVSAFASVLLILVILGDVFTSSPMAVSRQMSPAPATYAEEQAREAQIEPTSQAAAPQQEAPQIMMEQALPPTSAAEAPVEATGKAAPMAAGTLGAAGAAPYPAPALMSPMSTTLTGVVTPTEAIPEATPIAAAPTAAMDVQANQAAQAMETEPKAQAEEPFWNVWRVAELLLLLLVIAAGILAVRLRRAGN